MKRFFISLGLLLSSGILIVLNIAEVIVTLYFLISLKALDSFSVENYLIYISLILFFVTTLFSLIYNFFTIINFNKGRSSKKSLFLSFIYLILFILNNVYYIFIFKLDSYISTFICFSCLTIFFFVLQLIGNISNYKKLN